MSTMRPFRLGDVEPQAHTGDMPADRVITIKVKYIVVAVCVAASLGLAFATFLVVTHHGPPAPAPQAIAIQACEKAVRDTLRSPATAQFSGEVARADGPTVWRISGDVDADNPFGALIRKHYTCVAQGGDAQWTGGSVELT